MAPLAVGLVHEGDLMLTRVLLDLADTGRVDLSFIRDRRMAPLDLPARVIPVSATESIWSRWEECVRQCDAVLPIAPESGGVLERLSRLVVANHKLLLGSAPEAVRIAASKIETAELLARHGIPTLTTVTVRDPIPYAPDGWVVKPDDGAGCEHTHHFATRDSLRSWLQHAEENHVVQPYLPGIAASASLICHAGSAWLLACNRQMVNCIGGELHCTGIGVNALPGYEDQVKPIIEQVARILPGLSGFVGVDLVFTRRGPVVVEINPRLTTAYVGLRDCMAINPGALLLDLLIDGKPPAHDVRALGSCLVALT
ncbi:MAG: ATP-grasp domain-containing protein [Gammaproteobacteria bacterium]